MMMTEDRPDSLLLNVLLKKRDVRKFYITDDQDDDESRS